MIKDFSHKAESNLRGLRSELEQELKKTQRNREEDTIHSELRSVSVKLEKQEAI